MFPKNGGAREDWIKGVEEVERGNCRLAVAHFEQHLRVNGTHFLSLFNYAYVQERGGEEWKALRAYTTALSV